MKNIISILLFGQLLITGSIYCQQKKMRPLKELITTKESGWTLVQEWISTAKNNITVLPKDSVRADSALYQAQVTTRSPMGAIVHETGGILIDHGWIRILGSGSDKLNRSLMAWNKGKSFEQAGQQPSFLLIADDVLGGFFALNAGGIDSAGIGKMYYFAPDNLTWEPMNVTYSEFICFCFCGDLEKFYNGYRWKNWQNDVENLNGTSGFHIYPPLWTKEGRDINSVSKKAVPIQELWDLYFNSKEKE